MAQRTKGGAGRGPRRLAAAGAALWLATACSPDPLAGDDGQVCTLDKVLDGDSLLATCGGRSVEVRLYCIDAPEYRQAPWDRRSRRHLREAATRELRLAERDRDRYGRTVAEVYTAGPDKRLLNLEQVASGQAAVYRKYCDDPRYEHAERKAREARLGIWSEPGEHQTPWRFRHRSR